MVVAVGFLEERCPLQPVYPFIMNRDYIIGPIERKERQVSTNGLHAVCVGFLELTEH